MINTSAKTVNYNPATKKPCHCSEAKQAACPMKIALGINDDPKEFFTMTSAAESKAIAPGVVSVPVPSVSAEKPGEVRVPDSPNAMAVGENAEIPKWSASGANPGVIAVLDE